ncbi:hypothetical protein Bca4012_072632 [Brassica carinata]|uniref:Uncharacterized protein n=2 Tax=Brassica TaxID=3705 RepID=A0A0D3CFS3_BRAOL|nr:unnamed protein product [Brassica napus]CDY64306.1 BnaCnng43760D [Brassica napus]
MVEAVLCGALFLLLNESGLGKGFSSIPWLLASLNLLDDGFSSINYKGGIGLASALYDLPSEGVVLLGERRFCHYFRILMEQRFVSICFYRNFFEADTDLQLVSSQAATVDIRRTKLFEKFVYALIRETPTMMLGRMTAVVAVLYGKIYVMGGCRADESTHWSEGFDTKIRIGNLYLTLALSPPSLKSKQ